MALIFLSLGWLVGLYMGQQAGIAGMAETDVATTEWIKPWFGGLGSLAVFAALLGKDDRRLWVTALAVALGLLGAWRALSFLSVEDPLIVESGNVALRGTIATRPEPRDAALLLVLEVDGFRYREGWESIRSRVLVRTDRYDNWAYGDRVLARGTLRHLDSGSGYWAEHLAKQGIRTTMEYPHLTLEERPRDPDFWKLVNAVRSRLDSLCAQLFPEPQASLLAGILVGARASMPVEFRDALNATGTSHIVAVSGFNVTVVAGLAELAALRYLARRRATILAILAVWLYSLLTGLPPSATRAAIMCTLTLSAKLVGRGGDALSFLCLSGAFMTGMDPLILYDLGFQLSFLATAGLVLLEPVLRAGLTRLPGWLSASLSVTLAAQLATLPIMVGSFHTLSLVAPLANLLIAPMLPGLMVLGALAVALGAITLPLGQLAAPAAWLYLTYLVEVISWTARLPHAAVSTGGLEAVAVVVYYLLLLGLGVWPQAEVRRFRDITISFTERLPRWVIVGGMAALLSLAVLTLSGRPDGKTHVYFLDVGHGEAVLIRGPEGHFILVDGGPSPISIATALGRRLGFLDRRIDAVVLTGYGGGRMTGLIDTVSRHPVGLVVQPGMPDGRAGRIWRELLHERGVPVLAAQAGKRIPLGVDVWLELLWVSPDPLEEDASMAIRLVAGKVSVLLLGDLARGEQAELARVVPGKVEALLVPHRGAAGALDERLLHAASPRVAVISAGAANRYGHPAESILEMLEKTTLFRTDRHGTIELVIGQDGYEVFTDR